MDHLNDKWLIVLVIFIMTTGVYLFVFSLSLFKWTCVALNGSRFESDVTPRFKTRDIVHEEREFFSTKENLIIKNSVISNADSRVKYLQLGYYEDF